MIFILGLLIFFFLLALWDWLSNKDYYEINYMMCPYVTFFVGNNLSYLFMQEKGKPHIMDVVNKCVTIKPIRLNEKEI